MSNDWDNEKTGGYFLLSSFLHIALALSVSWLGFEQLRPLNQGTIEIELSNIAPGPSRLGQQTQSKDESPTPLPLAPKKTKKKASKKITLAKKKPSRKKRSNTIAPKIPEIKNNHKIIPTADISSEVVIPESNDDHNASNEFADEVLDKITEDQEEEETAHRKFLENEIAQEITMAEEEWIEDNDSEIEQDDPIQLTKQEIAEAIPQKTRALPAKKIQKGTLRNNLRYGVPNGVRDISELQAMPGNRPPAYNLDDRLAKKEGTIVLQAYVTRKGLLQNFKLINGTGHRTLDKKTLKAFKKYRFQSGQEGWVQMAFIWTLKGEAQQYPTRLRRRATENQTPRILGRQ